MSGLSAMCTAASEDERVIVMMKSVARKPNRTSTVSLPGQNESKRSSIAIEPSPWGLSSATRRYMGTMPKRVKSTMSTVAMGERAPAASAAMPGM
jgi:hypothetical protein